MRKTTQRSLPTLDANPSPSAVGGDPSSFECNQQNVSNAVTNTPLSLLPSASRHTKCHRRRRQIQNESIPTVIPPAYYAPFVPDGEILDSIVVARDGRVDKDQQGNILKRGALDGEEVLAIKQGVENNFRQMAGERRILPVQGGSTEQNRQRHLGAPTSANNEDKQRGKKRKQQSMASLSAFHSREKDEIPGGGATVEQQGLRNHNDHASGASSDAATATVHGMMSMMSAPPRQGLPFQPPSFGSHLLLGNVDPSSSLALRLAEMQAAHQIVNSLHARTRIDSWPFTPSASILSLHYPLMESSGLQTTRLTTTPDTSIVPWLGAMAARGISSMGLFSTPLRSNPSISAAVGLEDVDSARRITIPPVVPTDAVRQSSTSEIHTGARSDGITMLSDRTMQGLAATGLEDKKMDGNREGAPLGMVDRAPLFLHHQSLPTVSQGDHGSAHTASPPLDSTDRKKSGQGVHDKTSNQSDKGVVPVAEGQPEGGDRKVKMSSKKPFVGGANGEDPVVRAARLGTAADRSKSQDDHDQISRVLYVDGDEQYLTEYQCLLRKQLEVFEAGPHDIRGSTQGRNVPILLGQVGLRCRHCANLPLAARTKGAVYYSQTVEGMYQIAQNMSKVHLCQRCYRIPPDIQQDLISLKNECRRATGGKEYWTAALTSMGVYEDGAILRMKKG